MRRSGWILKALLPVLMAGLVGLPAPAQQLEEDPYLQRSSVTKQQTQPPVLTGEVSVESAMVMEQDVDWYAWYLAARRHVAEHGGFSDCPLGTMIRFHKNGYVEALSNKPACRFSAALKRFPLPADSRLKAILLPVRSGKLPPASPTELYQHLNRNR
jgi:hypothetical protein